jgi:hypothetical protein
MKRRGGGTEPDFEYIRQDRSMLTAQKVDFGPEAGPICEATCVIRSGTNRLQ